MALFRLVNRMAARALERFLPGVQRPTPLQATAAYLRLAEELIARNPNAGADARRVYQVLFGFFLSAYSRRWPGGDELRARLAVRWLSGDDLEAEEAGQLGLSPSGRSDGLDSLPDDQAIESVLIALGEHARLYDQALLLCFDQVDNLNAEQIRALAQFLHPLIEHARNLLVVTSGVQQKLLEFVLG